MIVEGQIHGAVTQGIGEALFEEVVDDGEGQLPTATLMDHALPRADDLPTPEIGTKLAIRPESLLRRADARPDQLS